MNSFDVRFNWCILFLLSSFVYCLAAEQHSDADPSPDTGMIQTDTPVMPPRPIEVETQLRAALAARGTAYLPRTKHLLENGQPVFINRLILEDSPYLLQHAHNPVDWYAWGPEAFKKARDEDKPIFLSIGYSTCHWCHVMEHESFDNADIARLMNENFVSIKVDRELLPDVDAIYMTAVMLTSGHGGWPMSSFLTQEGNPFFSGTYYPPEQFKDILQRVNEAWETRRELIQDQSEQIMTGVRRAMASRRDAQRIDLTVINQAVTHILAHYDRREGGFGQAPKFPNEPYLFLLLEAVQRNGDMSTLTAIEHSLNAMARGGIYDQIGGGFHRYSTDNRWLVPHFEKMLYNQANLVRIYLRAYQITGKPEYARIARETLDYILREMTSPEGGFYSATDADSEGGEGNFFLWDINQIENALPPAEAELAIGVFNITPQGNFEGRNILYLPVALQDYASRENLPLPELSVSLERLKAKLRLARNKRPAPLRDDKIITAWNGMMISAFADAAMIFQEPRYLDTAVNAANYILTKNRDDSGRYWRASLGDHTSIEARQEDYACFAEALVSLYDRTNHLSWLAQAEKVTLHMIDLFWDTEAGGFFMNAGLTESLLPARPKEASDSASPSGNSVALRVLTKLARRTGKEIYLDHAEATLAAFSSEIKQHPHAHSYLLTGTAELLYGEQNTLQYGSRGNVVAEVTVKPDGHAQTLLTVTVRIAPGWHINAHQPLDRYLKATGLRMNSDQSGWHLYDVEYPSPLIKKLGFQQDELALYENNIEIRARIGKPGVADSNQLKVPPPVHLDIQACNDELCLPPESLVLSLFPVQFSRDMEGDD